MQCAHRHERPGDRRRRVAMRAVVVARVREVGRYATTSRSCTDAGS
jgi:hypothetical protein